MDIFVVVSSVLSNSQAFVKMVGVNVSAMEEQVTQVEGEVGTLPGAFKKIFRTMAVPGFLNVSSLYMHTCLPYYLAYLEIIQLVSNVSFYLFFLQKPASPRRQSQKHQELPSVFRTDDYFKPQSEQ